MDRYLDSPSPSHPSFNDAQYHCMSVSGMLFGIGLRRRIGGPTELNTRALEALPVKPGTEL